MGIIHNFHWNRLTGYSFMGTIYIFMGTSYLFMGIRNVV